MFSTQSLPKLSFREREHVEIKSVNEGQNSKVLPSTHIIWSGYKARRSYNRGLFLTVLDPAIFMRKN